MPPELETTLETLDSLIRAFTFPVPALVYLVPDPFGTLGHEDDGAAVFYGLGGVVKRFVGLVEVDVLRVASAGDDDGVCGLDLDLVHGVHSLNPFAVGFDKVPCNGSNDSFLAVEYHVQDEVDSANFYGFLHILPDRAVDSSGNRLFFHH